MKTYPEGTRWRVANKTTGDVGLAIASYEEAMSVLWQARHEAKVAGHLFTYRLMAITPRRTVEQRIAEAVKTERAAVRGEIDEAVFEARKAELVRADKRIAEAVRERTETILTEWQAPLSESKRGPLDKHFADWLRDLRDGKVR